MTTQPATDPPPRGRLRPRSPGREALGRAWARWSALVTQGVLLVSRAEPVYALAGPIFEKELRVSGTRVRTYILRFVYVGVLGLLVGMVWLGAVTIPSLTQPRVAYAYAMPEAGKAVQAIVIWFLFSTLQLIAVPMLSTSISDEIYHRTLGVLMTTPITSLQIVAGKLLGKWSQLALLAAMSLPVLLVVRALGGVPWGFVVAGLSITLVTALVAGAISLFFSIGAPSAVVVILQTLVAMAVLFVLPPIAWPGAFAFKAGAGAAAWFVGHTNPYVALYLVTSEMTSPAAGASTFAWWMHCLEMLALAAALVGVSVLLVRLSGLRQLAGAPAGWSATIGLGSRAGRPGRVRRIWGSPVAWRAIQTRLIRVRPLAVLGWIGGLAAMTATYFIFARYGMLGDLGLQFTYCLVLGLIGLVWTAALAATGIAGEKEAGTWPLLLVTPLEGRQIITGKALGVFRRCLPPWILLGFHVAIFSMVGLLNPTMLIHVGMLVAGVVGLLTGTGLFFGTCFRRTWAAVTMNLGFCLFFWLFLPVGVCFVMLVVGVVLSLQFTPLLVYVSTHPITQLVVLVDATGGVGNASKGLGDLAYDWPVGGAGFIGTTAVIFGTAGAQIAVGWAFALWASSRVRRSVF